MSGFPFDACPASPQGRGRRIGNGRTVAGFFVFSRMKTRQHGTTPWMMLGAALLLPLLVQFSALAIPMERAWGFDALRYLPASMPVFLLVLPVALYLALRGMEIDPLRTPIALLLLLLALAPPLLWPMETYFYGDGGLLVPQVHRFSVDGSFDAGMLLNLKSAPLAGALLLLAMKAGPVLGEVIDVLMPTDALYPFHWISVLCLSVAVIYVLRVARGPQRLALLLALAGTAGVLFYSGYVEYYTPVFTALFVFVIAAERSLGGKTGIGPVLSAYALAVVSHYMALALLPSLLFVLAARNETLRARLRHLRHADVRAGLAAGGALVAAWVLFYLAAGFADSASRIVMPVAAQESPAGLQSYTLLSAAHLADILNLFVLLAPAGLVALLWTWTARFRDRKFGDGVEAFHALNVVLLAGFALFANATLGLSRDWDLLAPLGIVILLAAISGLRRRYDERAAVALAMVSVLLTLPWTQLHRDGEATATRFERIMQRDAGLMYGDYALSGYDALRKYRHRRGDLRAEIRLTKQMIGLLDYPQHYRELSRMAQMLARSEPDTTVALQRWMLGRLHERMTTLENAGMTQDYSISIRAIDSLTQAIGFLALGNGWYGELHSRIEAIALGTRNAVPYPAIAGLAMYREGAYEVAAGQFEAALREGFSNPTVYLFHGNALALSQQYSESLSRFEEGVRTYPEDGMLRFTLGKYYVRARVQPERAIELLRWCVERNDPAEHMAEANALLHGLRARQR
jgi:tetratricopeptide (TPR) repeat protein